MTRAWSMGQRAKGIRYKAYLFYSMPYTISQKIPKSNAYPSLFVSLNQDFAVGFVTRRRKPQ
jgi:hypothetical protein